jgi:hypothetical protein
LGQLLGGKTKLPRSLPSANLLLPCLKAQLTTLCGACLCQLLRGKTELRTLLCGTLQHACSLQAKLPLKLRRRNTRLSLLLCGLRGKLLCRQPERPALLRGLSQKLLRRNTRRRLLLQKLTSKLFGAHAHLRRLPGKLPLKLRRRNTELTRQLLCALAELARA